jgi:two-component system, LytTR family, response regulator
MIRTLIADDEPLVRQGIKALLAGESDIAIVGEARDGGEALQQVQELEPDLLFLDVRMPELDGFEVLEALETLPAVVFVTAHDEYALRAFDVHAVDYVLKPFDSLRFAEALRRVRGRLAMPAATRDVSALLESLRRERSYLDRLLVKRGKQIVFVDVASIDWFEAADNYVRVHVEDATHLIRHTIKGLESRLDPQYFVRIHRSTIVNLKRVTSLEPTPGGDYQVRLATGAVVLLSRNYREQFQERVGWRL